MIAMACSPHQARGTSRRRGVPGRGPRRSSRLRLSHGVCCRTDGRSPASSERAPSMLYFAYGSNLDPAQIRERAPGHRVVGMAALRDHSLEFPLYSPNWGGGVASVRPHRGDTVWGIVYDVTDEDFATLDRHEGFRVEGD